MPQNLSGNNVSRVWIVGEKIYKRQPMYLADNEFYALKLLSDTPYVPKASRISDETIEMELLKNNFDSFHPNIFLNECKKFRDVLKSRNLRHGDLTRPHIFVNRNLPVVIDWAESRILGDPRPDKRREGDSYWLNFTVMKILEEIKCHR